jgi:hypothetical protein
LSVLSVCAPLGASAITASSFTNQATIINFDNLTGGNCSLCGPSVTSQYAALGVQFNNPSFPGQDTADTNLTFGIPNSSPPNALYIAQGGHINDLPAMPFQILFSVPVTMVGFDYASSPDSFLRLDAYDANGALLESLMYVGGPSPIGLGGFAGIQESTSIKRLDVSYHPNSDPSRTFNFSIDNLEFENAPEPRTFGLIAIGLFGIFLGRRRSLPSP